MTDEITMGMSDLLQHKMYQHIHDERIMCAKCLTKGYLLHAEHTRPLIDALQKIADEDYRGNRPQSAVTAFNALAKYKASVGEEQNG